MVCCWSLLVLCGFPICHVIFECVLVIALKFFFFGWFLETKDKHALPSREVFHYFCQAPWATTGKYSYPGYKCTGEPFCDRNLPGTIVFPFPSSHLFSAKAAFSTIPKDNLFLVHFYPKGLGPHFNGKRVSYYTSQLGWAQDLTFQLHLPTPLRLRKPLTPACKWALLD